MDKDSRYQWIESRLLTTLEPKRDALLQLIQNADNRLAQLSYKSSKSLLFSI